MPSSTTVGADVEALETLAADFDRGAEELRSLSARLAGAIEAAHDWQGPDAQRCKEEWGGFARERMTGVGDALAAAGKVLAQHAREQEQASRADDVGVGTGYGLLRFVNDVTTLYAFASKPITSLMKATSLVTFLRTMQAARLGTVGADAIRTALGTFTGLSKTGLWGTLGKLSLPLTVFSGLGDAVTGGGYEGWRDGFTRGFGIAGAAGAGALLASSAGLLALGPVGLGIAAAGVTAYGLWSAGNVVVDNWDTIRDTGARVVTTVGDTVGRAWEGVGNGYESAIGWARGLLGGTRPATAGAGA